MSDELTPEHQPPTAEEVASIRGILVETALPTAARPHEEKAPGDFDRLVAEVERLRGENKRLRNEVCRVASFAATCRIQNTDEWFDLLVQTLNEAAVAVGDKKRFVRDKDLIRLADPEAK